MGRQTFIWNSFQGSAIVMQSCVPYSLQNPIIRNSNPRSRFLVVPANTCHRFHQNGKRLSHFELSSHTKMTWVKSSEYHERTGMVPTNQVPITQSADPGTTKWRNPAQCNQYQEGPKCPNYCIINLTWNTVYLTQYQQGRILLQRTPNTLTAAQSVDS